MAPIKRSAFSLAQFVFSPGADSWSLSTTQDSRRAFVSGCATWVSCFAAAQKAEAKQERNELLCGTGFFTNIWQYKCTDLGDIEDEGKSRKLDESENDKLNSLMGKLGWFRELS